MKKKISPPASKAEGEIRKLRRRIDQVDRQLLKALAERLENVARIGRIKVAHGMPLQQKSRWAQLMKERLAISTRLGLGKPFTRDLYGLIHREALRIQKDLSRSRKKSSKK